MSGPVDRFAPVAADYARFRPSYPDALIAYLAGVAPRRELAWDCATGSGQAAVGLARHFARVIATDASAAQLVHAMPHPRIEYRVASAEASGLPAASADAVTVAQAAHWLDRPRFFAEARRVLVPGGIVALWAYGHAEIAPEIDRLLRVFHDETVGPYWPAERELVVTGYRTIAFPAAFSEVTAPGFAIERDLTLDALAGYIRTWSATQAFVDREGRDPVEGLVALLSPHWGDPAAARRVRWPLALRVGRGKSA